MAGRTSFVIKNGAVRLTSIALRHSSAVRSGKRVDSGSAALLMRMSIRPKRSSVRRAISSGTPSAATSPGTAKARSPISFASASARSRLRTFTATVAPRSCRRAATARPRPRHAPVTTATRPAKSAFSIRRIVLPCLSSAHVHERRDQGTENNDAGLNGTQDHRPQARSNFPCNQKGIANTQKVDRTPARGSLHRLIRQTAESLAEKAPLNVNLRCRVRRCRVFLHQQILDTAQLNDCGGDRDQRFRCSVFDYQTEQLLNG